MIASLAGNADVVAFATSNVHVAFASQPFDSYRTKFHANPKHACMIKPAGLAPEQSSCSIVLFGGLLSPYPSGAQAHVACTAASSVTKHPTPS